MVNNSSNRPNTGIRPNTGVRPNTPVMSRKFGPGMVRRVGSARMSVDFAIGEEWFDFPEAFESGELRLIEQDAASVAPGDSGVLPTALSGAVASSGEIAPSGEAGEVASATVPGEALLSSASVAPHTSKGSGMSIKEFGKAKLAAARLAVGDTVRTKDKGVGRVVDSGEKDFVVQFPKEWKRYRFPQDVNSGLVKRVDRKKKSK